MGHPMDCEIDEALDREARARHLAAQGARFTHDGVTLTDDECRDVLRWVREPWGRIPDALRFNGSHNAIGIWTTTGRLPMLTPALIDAMRDHLEPWQECRRDEVKPGEVFRVGDAERLALPPPIDRAPSDDRWWAHQPGAARLDYTFGDSLVLVRRPRPTLTLGEVEPGQRFLFLDDKEQAPCIRTRGGYVSTLSWHTCRIGPDGCVVSRDTPVTLVEEPTRD